MERLDDVLGYKDLKIYQNSDYFSFSLDSIILANYSNIRLRDKNIIDSENLIDPKKLVFYSLIDEVNNKVYEDAFAMEKMALD